MPFRQFVGQPLLAPLWLLLPQRDHLRHYGGGRPVGLVRGVAGKPFQTRIARCQKTRLPIIEGPSADVGHLTGLRDIAGRLPRLEPEPPLRRRGEGEMGPCHVVRLGLSWGYRVLLLVHSAWHTAR